MTRRCQTGLPQPSGRRPRRRRRASASVAAQALEEGGQLAPLAARGSVAIVLLATDLRRVARLAGLLDDLVELTAIEPDTAACRAVVDLDAVSLGHQQDRTVDGAPISNSLSGKRIRSTCGGSGFSDPGAAQCIGAPTDGVCRQLPIREPTPSVRTDAPAGFPSCPHPTARRRWPAMVNVRSRLTRLVWLSIAAAVATIALKTLAWRLTDSVGFLSDAAESVVNLVAALVALVTIRWATRPPDDEHMYGHEKAEYFSAGVEGALILVAAASITWFAIGRLLHPVAIEDAGVGIVVSAAASSINLVVGLILIRAGREHRSITVEADGKHLLTDVWTSVGVIVGVALVWMTGWERLDPLIALAVAANIVFMGATLIRRSAEGYSTTRSCRRSTRRSTRCSHAPASTAFGSTPSGPVSQAAARSSPSMSSSRGPGRSSRATTSRSGSRARSGPRSPTPACSRTSSRSRTRPRSPTSSSTANASEAGVYLVENFSFLTKATEV